jgi:23S rRNA pseudouridine1911/1915/1917 synthase
MNSFTVKEEAPLLEYLLKHLQGYKRTTLKSLLRFGAISINGSTTTLFNAPLHVGDKVEIQSVKSSKKVPASYPFKVVFEDDSIIVIDKQAGFFTIATSKVETTTIFYKLNEYIRSKSTSREKQLFIVHRLDKEVSGLLVFAKNYAAKEYLQTHWKEAEKRYLAIVEGVPEKKTGTLASYLSENQFLKVYSGPKSAGAKYSVTHYKVVEEGYDCALLEIILETGRKHQIRVHLSDFGHPIFGDQKYGASEKVLKDRNNPYRRLALHAYQLSIPHPVTKEQLSFKSELPANLRQILKAEPH